MGKPVQFPSETKADSWLAPIWLDERAEAYPGPTDLGADGVSHKGPSPGCNPPGAPRISNKGFLPITRDQYLSLLDTLGRVIRTGKRGFIPPELPPILERLQLDAKGWLDSIWDMFCVSPIRTRTPAVNSIG
jgi:hypothetical protein